MNKNETIKALSTPVRWGIIGCGDVCEVKSGPAFYKISNSCLVAVMRRNPKKAEDFAHRHQVSRWYSDANQLINDPEVDAIYVATPPSSHSSYAIQAMKAGKHVYVEKPMALTYHQCEEMIKVSNEMGVHLLVAYYRRSLPYFVKVKEFIEKKEIGQVVSVNVCFRAPPRQQDYNPANWWRVQPEIAGGGYFYDMACHTLDILDFILGEIVDASGYVANCAGLYSVEDTVTASFRFQSGVVGCGEWCYAAPDSLSCDTVEIMGLLGNIKFASFSFDPFIVKIGNSLSKFDFPPPEHIQQPMIEAVVTQLCGNGNSPSDEVSAARTNWVMEKIFRSLNNLFSLKSNLFHVSPIITF